MKFAIAAFLVATVVAKGKGKGKGKKLGKGKSKDKRNKPFWPNKDHTHDVEDVWWECNF